MARVHAGELPGPTLGLVFRNLGAFLPTVGVLWAVASALGLVEAITLRGSVFRAITARQASGLSFHDLIAPLVVSIGLGLVAAALNVVNTPIAMAVAARVADGQRPTFAQAWAQARPRLGNFVATWLLMVLAILGVFLLLLVPFALSLAAPVLGAILVFVGFVAFAVFAILLFLRWAVAGPVSLFERHGPTENLRRSSGLTAGSRGSIFGAYLLTALALFVPYIVVSIPLGIAAGVSAPRTGMVNPQDFAPSLTVGILQWALGALFSFVVLCAFSTLNVLIYRGLTAPSDVAPPEPTLGPIGGAP